MIRHRRIAALAVLTLSSAGCPAFLADDFVIGEPTSKVDAEPDVLADAAVPDAPVPEETGADVTGTDVTGTDVTDAVADAVADADAGAADGATDSSDAADADGAPGCAKPCGVGRACVTGSCTPAWVATAAPPVGFGARQRAASCAMGSRVFVWGGATNATDLADGAIYDPATDAWSSISTTGAPTARVGAACVWTGSVVVVFGGGDLAGTADSNGGGRYDPGTNTWQTLSTGGAPSARRYAHAYWTGSRVAVFGGETKAGAGARDALLYDPVTDNWSAKAGGSPPASLDQSVGVSGTDLLVFGGSPDLSTLAAFNPTGNAWSAPADVSPPAARTGAFGVGAGSTFVAWGGSTGGSVVADGKRYSGTTWNAVSSVGAPSARRSRRGVAGAALAASTTEVMIVGGLGTASTQFNTDGAVYDVSGDAWSPIPSWPSGADHASGVMIFTAGELVIWGGVHGGNVTATGERWLR